MSEHHRHHRHESRLGVFLRANLIEITAAVFVALGLFLLLERMSIRSTLARWVTAGARSALDALGHVDNAVAETISRLTLSDALGLILILGAVIALVLRLRWRLVRAASLTTLRCPRCGAGIHRAHRGFRDRLMCLIVPVRRYRCSNQECRWDGIRVVVGKHSQEAAVTTPPVVPDLADGNSAE
jgi:surface antigen